MKPLIAYDEGRTAMQELTSTQTMITSLISNDDDQSQSEKIKELTTYVEKYENILIESETNEGKVSTLSKFNIKLINYLFFRIGD